MAKMTDCFLYRDLEVETAGEDELLASDRGFTRYNLDGRCLVNQRTGEVHTIPALAASRPDWYFGTGRGGFASTCPKVSMVQLIEACVAVNPGLMSADIEELCRNGHPLAKFPSNAVFTACLASQAKVRKWKDGKEVLGLQAERGYITDMTYTR